MVKRGNILQNSFWYGIEIAADIVLGAIASIVTARVMGPELLGHFVYFVFLTNVAGRLGGLGMASAAKKYIAEHLARDEKGLVRLVFFAVLRMQTVLAVVIPLLGIGFLMLFGDPTHRTMACLLVLSIGPALVSVVPAMANVAAESFSRNVPGALLGLFAYVTTVALTLTLDWGLVGLASAVLLRRSVEMTVRLWPAIRWMKSLPVVPSPEGLNRKVLAFSGQALAVSVLMIVVWDRSELLFLKQFSSITELAFYTVAFGLTEQILMLPNIFGGAVGAALMAEHGRNQDRAGERAANAMRYMCLMVFPIHVGIAALSSPLIRLTYGPAYLPAIHVLSIAMLLAIPKAFFWMPWSVYQAADRQATMFRWLLAAAILNLTLDATLIPHYGSIGAALANGISQAFAVISMWPTAARLCHLRLPWNSLVRIAFAAAVMGAVVALAPWLLHSLAATVLGIVLGVLLYGVLLRLTRALGQEDGEAFSQLTGRLPGSLRRLLARAVRLLGASAGPVPQSAPVVD